MPALWLFAGSVTHAETNPETPNFASQIRPLLSDHCFACHGPDEHERQAGVRLDTADGIADVIDPDAWDESLIVERLRTDDPDMIMPPPEYHKPLSDESKQLLESWVASGAEFQAHWAFSAPRRHSHTIDNEDHRASDRIDHWLDQTIADAGLTQNVPADLAVLARRTAFDLTGLPPDWETVQHFVNDKSPGAYEAYVDRLLESPAYGEHMGRYWLDLVRYGDTHGLHLDNYREMWHYRDWVIGAFNSNKPFDVFITEQLAGDLLPEPSIDQQIASGFNRLNVTTSEGGSIYDEVFARNVMDRTDAFGSIFLGLTTGCAVCHDHKFDPITQKDYYSLSAFFNSLDGRALDGNKKDHPPSIKLPSESQKAQREEIQKEIRITDEQMRGPLEEVDAAQLAWQQSLTAPSDIAYSPLVPTSSKSESGSLTRIQDGNVVLDQAKPKDHIAIVFEVPPGTWQTIQLNALTDDQNPRVGISDNGNAVLSEITFEFRENTTPHAIWQPLDIAAARASKQQDDKGFAIEKSIDGKIDPKTGWAVAGHEDQGPRSAQFQLASPISATKSSTKAELRVRISYQSVYAKHMLRTVNFEVSQQGLRIPSQQRIALGEVHVVGPLEIDDPKQAYSHEFAGEMRKEFDPDAVIDSQGRTYRWQHRADVVPVVANGLPASQQADSVTVLHQSIDVAGPQTIEFSIGNDGGHVVFLNGAKVGEQKGPGKFKPRRKTYSLKLTKGTNHLFIRCIGYRDQGRVAYSYQSPNVEVPAELARRLRSLAKTSLTETSTEDRKITKQATEDLNSIRSFYRDFHCKHPQWLALQDMREGLNKMSEDLEKQIPTTLIWKETNPPRDAFILQRGQYDAPGEKVERNTLSFLPPMEESAPKDRLGLAQWLVHEDHPLTARVAVNRFWQQVFGTGLVKTSEDFGSQGTPPSHPELLDELAIDFRESGWNVKKFMKRLVMTQAYQRSSHASPSMLAVDPSNRLLVRGPRFRLDAEMLRDQTLALSGLLVDQRGGPSVKPPQPAGLWAAVGYTNSDTATFVPDEGDRIYRRSVYTFWKRTSAPAVMTTFDAPSRESCTARRERTNTPLQALLLLNEPQTLKASQQLAEVALAWDDLPTEETNALRATRLFQQVVLRRPEPSEVATLSSLATDLEHYYSNHLDQAQALVGISDADLAAWSVLSNTLLNLDEVVNK